MSILGQGVLKRFESKYVITETGCWEWIAGKPASRTGKRYGSFHHNGKTRSAHIVSYELHVGPVPDGMELDHMCKNPPCVNPTHLEPVTHKTNVERGSLSEVRRSAVKEFCKHGHTMSGDNVAVWGGTRYCKTCKSERSRKARNVNS